MPVQNRLTKLDPSILCVLRFYCSYVYRQAKSGFPMRSEGFPVTKRPLTSGASYVKAEYRENTLLCARVTRVTTRVYIYRPTHTPTLWKASYPYWTTSTPASTSFYDLRSMHVRLRFTFTLYIYTTALCPRNFIRACRLRSRNFHVKVSGIKEGRETESTENKDEE